MKTTQIAIRLPNALLEQIDAVTAKVAAATPIPVTRVAIVRMLLAEGVERHLRKVAPR